MSSDIPQLKLSEIVEVTDYVANGSFASLKENVTYLTGNGYAVLVRLVNHNASWQGDRVFVDEKAYKFLSKSTLEAGDIVIGNVGANAGSVFRVPELGQSATLGPNAVRVRPRLNGDYRLSQDFLYYYLVSPVWQNSLQSIITGSAQPKFNKTALRGLQIPVPSIEFQGAVSSLMKAMDDRIALLRESNASLEAIAQALFKSWFVDFDPVRAKMEGRALEGMDEVTAALFPDSFEESDLGLVPRGWKLAPFGDFITRLSVGKKFDQKSASSSGEVPILDQGKSGLIGYHDEAPGVMASLDDPVVVFANHTCYMRLITFDFSAIQNVLPFKGKGVDTVWAYYATKNRVKFFEYKGHWPDFVIEKVALPTSELTQRFRSVVSPLVQRIRSNELQAESLASLRDTLLPRLISGQLCLSELTVD